MDEMQSGHSYPGQPPAQKRGGAFIWVSLTLVVAALVVAVAIMQGAYHRRSGNAPELPASHAVVPAGGPSPVELSNTFREVVKAVKPAVVYISTVERVQEQSVPGDFFGIPDGGGPRKRQGAGSGFIVTPDGYILTNNHVVRDANKIDVTLSDGRQFKAEVVGKDPNTDLAVIHIDATGLPVAYLGDSDKVEQGDWVLALGSPFGLQQTLTAGIVSATGRELNESQFNHYIQTDASINPGNSGGPLVNMQGEVIGINTMIIANPLSQGSVGIGFAINSNVARDVFKDLAKNGKVSRGYLGVFIEELDKARAHAVNLEPGVGVFVRDVPDPKSPAAKAGLRSRDVITAFNGKAIKTPRELTEAVASSPVHSSSRVDFIRDGEKQSVTVELSERPPDSVVAQAVPPSGEEGGQPVRLGIQAQSVTPEMAAKMNLRVPSGALIVGIQPGSPAAEAGAQHGDVIHAIDKVQVKSAEDLGEAARSLSAGEYLLEIERKGQRIFLNLNIE
jgi:serine protease Do